MEHFKKFDFDGFSVTWISDLNEKYPLHITDFPQLTPEIKKEMKLDEPIPIDFAAFLIEKDGKKALIDVGGGDYPEAPGHLLERFKEMKINPDEIDYIFISHAHWDHAYGYTKDNQIVYKNAKVYVSKPEYDGWNSFDDKTTESQFIKAAKKTALEFFEKAKNNLVLFNYGDTLPLGIIAIDGKGHTPGHTVYQIGKILFNGDLIHCFPFQFIYPEQYNVYDIDPKNSVETRKRIIKMAKENNLILTGNHFPYPYLISELPK